LLRLAGIDTSDPEQLSRLLRVFVDAIDSWGRDMEGDLVPAAKDMIRSLQRDGVSINDEGELTTSVVALNVRFQTSPGLSDPRSFNNTQSARPASGDHALAEGRGGDPQVASTERGPETRASL
jgi:hypothetical protein